VKLALLSPLPPEKNGIANYAEFFCSALQNNGIEVSTPLKGEEVFSSTDEVNSFVKQHDWNNFDLVHVELGGGRLREYAIIKALRRMYPNLPITATIHDPERLIWRSEKLPWPLNRLKDQGVLYKGAMLLVNPCALRDERRTAGQLDRLFTLTNTGAFFLQKRMRLTQNRISVIPHGNTEIPFKPLPPVDPLKLLYFGFIYKGKGIEDLIDAFGLAVKQYGSQGKGLKLTLAGGCAPETAFGQKVDYLSELKNQINTLGLNDFINWELDIPDDGISDLIQNHHVVVLPYQESKKIKLLGNMRGTSGALSWAIACGRGVITSDARSFSEEVGFGNGIVYPQGDIKILGEHIGMIFQQPELIASWAEKAHEIALEREWKKIAKKFKEVFSNIINGVVK